MPSSSKLQPPPAILLTEPHKETAEKAEIGYHPSSASKNLAQTRILERRDISLITEIIHIFGYPVSIYTFP